MRARLAYLMAAKKAKGDPIFDRELLDGATLDQDSYFGTAEIPVC